MIKINDRALIVALLLVPSAALAGCLDAPEALTIARFADGLAPVEGALTFRDTFAVDANGDPAALPEVLRSPGALPFGIQQLLPGSGAEPNIGVTSSGAVFVTVQDSTLRSRDKGVTWEIVHTFESPEMAITNADHLGTADPMLWVDTSTDRVYVNHMHPALICTYLAWSDDEGESWTERPMACGIPMVDHQKIITAPPGPATSPGVPAGVAYPSVFYLCLNKPMGGTIGAGDRLGGTWCATSFDGGLTFPYDTMIATCDGGGINGHPAPFPDGTVAVALGVCSKMPLTVVVTEDSGVTWEPRQCAPDRYNHEIDADITVTPDGTAYLLFRDRDQFAYLARSTDKFVTCDVFRVAPRDHVMNAFAGITSGSDGRIAMAYLGTRDEQDTDPDERPEPSAGLPGTVWHLFVTTSFDADTEDPTFITQQVTPDEDPVQIGCIWYYGGSGGPRVCRNLLDFIDMTRDDDGRWFVAITDGCVPRNGCTAKPYSSKIQTRESQVGVAVQDRGMSLFAEVGVLPELGLVPPARILR